MTRWWLLGVILFGSIFALFGLLRVDAGVLDSRTIRWTLILFLFGCYFAIVMFGTAEKKRSLSLLTQTFLGVVLALAVAALVGATAEGYVLALALGLVLGFTADYWMEHVQFP
ncbi:hypothetical protein [Pseudoxanthomonas sp. CF125]|uniref:hypothetical protein n=1 Tax=Pseudoxanthomonas sp. CF125 TaxID=1855303 RepID=UPI00088E1950|nr:hypothetical protein [Pseudoxanthomonas sp. CF125]SDQ84649.1 hypothetical protein SAMN05216569_2282 [Pseudoxanthomonas sp. CF125]